MILTFESFQKSLSKVSNERHLEVLEAAKESVDSIGNPSEGNFHLNFLVLFAQTYGTTCEDWMDFSDSCNLAKLYSLDENDFTTLSVTTAEHGPVPYFDTKEYKEIEIKQAQFEKEGWKLFKRHEDTGTRDDGTYDYKERFVDLIFYRPRFLSNKKINKTNQITGIFESWKKSQKIYNRDEQKFYDLYQDMKVEFAKAFNMKVVEKLKEVGFNVEVTSNTGDSGCSLLVNTIPMHIVNSNQLCFDNEKIYSNEFKNQVVFEILRKANVDPVIGGPKFTTATSLQYFFDKMELNLYINPKLRKATDIGVFDKE